MDGKKYTDKRKLQVKSTKSTNPASNRARARRVKTVAEKFAVYGKPGSRTGAQMEKVSKTRSITTPKRGTRTTRAISVTEPSFKRFTATDKNLSRNQTFVGRTKKRLARGAEGPKRSMPRKKK